MEIGGTISLLNVVLRQIGGALRAGQPSHKDGRAARLNEVLQFPGVARSTHAALARISGEVRHLRREREDVSRAASPVSSITWLIAP